MAEQVALGLNHTEVGKLAGMGRTAVCKRLSLLSLPQDVQALAERERLPFTALLLLTELPDAQAQRRVCRRAVEHALTTREVEREVARATGRAVRPARRSYRGGHPDALALSERLADAMTEAVGRPVGVKPLGRGRFEVRLVADSFEDALALGERVGADPGDDL